MHSAKALLTRRPALTYFALTLIISWGGILVALGADGFSTAPARLDQRMPFAVLAILAGPSVAGLLTTGLVDGRAGLRNLGRRLLRWRVGLRWYAVALLTAPVVAAATLLMLSLISPVFLPAIFITDDRASLLLTGLAVGLTGGLLEELGWTGLAVLKLRLRFGVLVSGLIAGLSWSVWHFPTSLWGSRDFAGDVPQIIYLAVVTFSFLPPYRVLMTWVYDRTQSLLVPTLMHASLVPSIFFVLQPPATGWAGVAYHLVLGAALWGVVAAVAVNKEGHLARRPLRRQTV